MYLAIISARPVKSMAEAYSYNGLDLPWCNGINTYAMRCPFIAQRFGELSNCAFARCVSGHVYATLKCSQACCIDDHPFDLILNPVLPYIATE